MGALFVYPLGVVDSHGQWMFGVSVGGPMIRSRDIMMAMDGGVGRGTKKVGTL